MTEDDDVYELVPTKHVMSRSGCYWFEDRMYHTDDCSCDDEYMESLDG